LRVYLEEKMQQAYCHKKSIKEMYSELGCSPKKAIPRWGWDGGYSIVRGTIWPCTFSSSGHSLYFVIKKPKKAKYFYATYRGMHIAELFEEEEEEEKNNI